MSEQIQQTVAKVVEASKPAENKPEASVAPTTPPTEAPKQDNSTDEFSSKFAALSRRERQLLEKEKKLKQIEEESNKRAQSAQSWEERIKKFKQNPSEIDNLLQEAGLSFDDYVNFKLGIQPEEKKLSPDEMYEKLKSEMEQNFKKLEEEKKQAAEAENAQIIENFRGEIESYLTKNADKYELINYQGDFNLVFDVIEEYYNTNGEVLEIEEAANHVERHLEELVDGATKLKKFASKFAPKTENVPTQSDSAKEIAEAVEEKKAASPTLSNSLNGSNSSYKTPALSIEESKKRAASLLRWT